MKKNICTHSFCSVHVFPLPSGPFSGRNQLHEICRVVAGQCLSLIQNEKQAGGGETLWFRLLSASRYVDSKREGFFRARLSEGGLLFSHKAQQSSL